MLADGVFSRTEKPLLVSLQILIGKQMLVENTTGKPIASLRIRVMMGNG